MKKKNRKFLVPLAALAGMFTTSQAFASLQNAPESGEPNNVTDSSNAIARDAIVLGDSQKLFKFTLRRNEKGAVVADHYSHESHASHSSHYSGS